MRKTQNKGLSLTPQTNKKNDVQQLQDDTIKINLEEKKEDVIVEDIIEEQNQIGKKRKINLDDSKKNIKNKTDYNLNDTIIRDIILNGDIHVQLISNIHGYFIDIRKYYKKYPTKRGIRMLASKFAIAADLLKNDLSELIHPLANLPNTVYSEAANITK